MSNKTMSEKSLFNIATYVYLVMFLLVYPLIMNNKYFDITKTKYNCFIYLSIGYFVIACVTIIADRVYDRRLAGISESGWRSVIANPLVWLALFVLTNIISFILTDNKQLAFTGQKGRLMGLMIYMVIAMVFFLLAKGSFVDEKITYVFCVPVMISFMIAIVQHMGINVFSLKTGINPKQYNIFISTLGNINIFASFVVLCIGVFLSLSIFSVRLESKIIGLGVITLSGMVIMIANSDSAYLGAFAIFVVVFILAYLNDLLREYFKAVIAFAAGTNLIILLNKYVVIEYDKRGGFAQMFDNMKFGALFLTAGIILYVTSCVIGNRYKNKISKINKRVLVCVFCFLLISGMAACYIIAENKNMEIVDFNYKWGTFRGYIWSKCAETFKGAPVINKIFGYGNESIYNVVSLPNLEEMKSVTGKVYDNAHNEFLQYLLTIGIAGVISYIGLFVSGIAYILKRAKNNCIAYAMAVAAIGYFAQSLINLNQPITTPYLFVFMGVGIGCVTNKRRS